MSKSKPSKRGGARPGAGRPPADVRLTRVIAFVTPEVANEVTHACTELGCTRGELFERALRALKVKGSKS